MPPLKLYNTLKRKKEIFRPSHAPRVSLYTCGPTVYNDAHIGNLRTYIFEDVLKRVLTINGYRVNHVMNITDVGHLTDDEDQGEDKIERAARQKKESVWQLAARYTQHFQADLTALHIQEPTRWCKATDHIAEQITLIKTLERKGFTYTLSDGVYFDTSRFPRYSALARLNIKGLKAGARVEMVTGKKHPTDFALWKLSYTNGRSFDPAQDDAARRRRMEWPSPWGIGFPGWHIECSAMSMKYLKLPIDIHCGGIDHIPVHHTNEIAQSEGATGKPFVRFWLHGEFLTIDESRMGKSQGNFLTLSGIVEKGYEPLAYRLLILQGHYRTRLDFSWQSLDAAARALEHVRSAIREQQNSLKKTKPAAAKQVSNFRNQFLRAINDDLNTAKTLALVWAILRSQTLAPRQKLALIKTIDAVLGLDLLTQKTISVPIKVRVLVEEREIARKQKNWALSDQYRTAIEKLGFELRDTPEGPKLTATTRRKGHAEPSASSK